MSAHRCLSAILFCLFATSAAIAQASPSCAVRPTSLAAMKDCYRPLLVFSPSARDPRLAEQSKSLDDAADDMMDRFVMLTPILPSSKGYHTPLDTPYAVLALPQMKAIRTRFHIPENRFVVLLLGEDGSIKLRSDQPVTAARLSALIDTMPTRQTEAERPHAN